MLSALTDLAALKEDITGVPVEHMTKHRADLSIGASWRVGSEPFVAIATETATGSVFESAEHAMFTVVSAASLVEAEAVAAKLGLKARIFRVRPSWSRPAELGSRRTRIFGKRVDATVWRASSYGRFGRKTTCRGSR